MPKIQISGGLFACLIAVYLPVAQYLFLPAPMTKAAGQEAWIALLIAAVAGTVLAGLPAVWVGVRHPNLSLAQIARQLLGKWGGGAVCLLYSAVLVDIYGLCLRDIVDFAQLVLLPGTPGIAIIVMFGGICLYGAWHGLEPVVRVAFQAMAFILISAFLLPLLQLREISIKNVDPFLYRGFGSVLSASFVALPWFTELVSVLSLVPHLKHRRAGYRWLWIGVAVGSLPLAMITLHMTLALGSELPARFLYPTYYLMQLVSVANILERMEILLVTVFLTGMFIKAGLYLYMAAETTAETFGLKHHHGTAVVMTAVGILIAHLWGSTLNLLHWEAGPVSVMLRLVLEVGIPVLLLAASVIRQALQERGSAHA